MHNRQAEKKVCKAETHPPPFRFSNGRSLVRESQNQTDMTVARVCEKVVEANSSNSFVSCLLSIEDLSLRGVTNVSLLDSP